MSDLAVNEILPRLGIQLSDADSVVGNPPVFEKSWCILHYGHRTNKKKKNTKLEIIRETVKERSREGWIVKGKKIAYAPGTQPENCLSPLPTTTIEPV